MPQSRVLVINLKLHGVKCLYSMSLLGLSVSKDKLYLYRHYFFARMSGCEVLWLARLSLCVCVCVSVCPWGYPRNQMRDIYAVFIWLEARDQPNTGFILRRVLAVFTRSAITPPKVNRFGWNLEHSEHIVGGWPWQILGEICTVVTAGEPGEILFSFVSK